MSDPEEYRDPQEEGKKLEAKGMQILFGGLLVVILLGGAVAWFIYSKLNL